MVKKIIYWLLCLEIYLRRTNITYSPWREKIKKYFPEYHSYNHKVDFMISHNNRVAYMGILKSGSSTLLMTFVETAQKRDEFILLRKQLIEKNNRPSRLPMFIRSKEKSELFHTNMKVVDFDFDNNQFMCAGREAGSWQNRPITLAELNNKFIFTFVRNPFTRLVSLFQGKYTKRPNGNYVFFVLYHSWVKNWLYEVKNFEMLAQHIAMLPNCYIDHHMRPQHIWFDTAKQHGVEIDFTGHLENIGKDFQKISTEFNLLPLKSLNTSQKEKTDWRDYYSPKTAKLIYKRYKKDFEQFGYEDEYPKLLEYLKNKRKAIC